LEKQRGPTKCETLLVQGYFGRTQRGEWIASVWASAQVNNHYPAMRPLDNILDELQFRDDCTFRPATRLPELPQGLRLPDDLSAFFGRFSEARLFGHPSDPRYHIPPPEEFVQIGIAILGQQTTEPVQQGWYTLADVRDGNYIAIDCHPSRLGYCYDAFHETIHLVSYCKVIAHSFTELMNIAAAAGDDAWWLKHGFKGYGSTE
jgi:hypothetical protein